MEVESSKTSCQAEVEAEERPSSPINDCAICLEQLSDKSFTNSCFHMFCFRCLKAWSKVKPECPLCKQDFCSIIHNIRSMDDYDEYHVPPAPMRFASPDSTSLFAQSLTQNTLGLPFRDLLRQRDFFSSARRFFSYRTTYIPGSFNVPRQERSSRLVIQPYVDNLQIQSSYPNIPSSSSHTSDLTNRKNVYLRDLELRPSNDGRHRSSSPEFYRENEGQLHRLGRWVNRELAAISQLGRHFNRDEVFSLIMDLLPNYYIQGAMFQSSLFPYLGMHTSRFIKEFYNFAISPYELEEYDRMSVYITQRTGSSLEFIVTVGSDETEEVQVIPRLTINHSTVQPWINLTRIPSSNYNLENGSRLSSSTSTCSHLPSASASGSGISTSQQVIDISDSENDDCVIIDEVKTTPQTIILDDSDDESPDTGIVPKSPIPSISGYRPPVKTDVNDNSSFLPSTPNCDSKFNVASTSSENCTKSTYKCNSKRRSPSSSSVISTDNSIVDYECDKELKERKRKNSKPKKVETRRGSFDSYLSSDFSFDCDDDDDSDWEANPKKKKRTRKHSDKSDKKTRKRKKTQHKSLKREKRADSENTHKSKRTSKSHKSKKSSKSTIESHSNSCVLKSTNNGSVSASSRYETNYSPIRPKLRSVVKKVKRNEYVDDNVPSTSYGIRCDGVNQTQAFVRRTFYSSDSD